MADAVNVNVKLEQQGTTASCATARDHKITMDRPGAKGGEDKGAMGGEVLLMGLGGCFMSNLLAAAQARDMALEGVGLEISGTLESAPARFSAISVKVTVPGQESEEIRKIITIAERACIVANTLKNSVDLTIEAA